MTEESEHTDETFRAVLITAAIENWRAMRIVHRALQKLDAGEAGRFISQLRYCDKRIEEALSSVSIRLVSVDAQRIDSGMAVSVVNAVDFNGDDQLIVEQMIEPIVMGPNGLLRAGSVKARKTNP